MRLATWQGFLVRDVQSLVVVDEVFANEAFVFNSFEIQITSVVQLPTIYLQLGIVLVFVICPWITGC
jgi:hypothetical protein